MTEGTRRIRQRPYRRCVWPDCGEDPTPRYHVPLCQHHAVFVWSHVDEHARRKLEEYDATVQRQLAYKRLIKKEDRDATPRDERPGHVYFVKVGGQIKIGWASDVFRRLKSYPPTSTLLAYEPGTMRDEQGLHNRFAHYRIGGREWYEAGEDLTKYIAGVRRNRGIPNVALLGPKRQATGRQPAQLRSRSGGNFKR